MPRHCTLCSHPEQAAIDGALVDGAQSLRDIARQWRVSKDAVARHKTDHLPAHLAKAEEAKAVSQADSLLDRLLALSQETAAILKEARAGQDNELALKAIARAERQIELQARLLGELKNNAIVNVLVLPQWQTIKAVIVEALGPYPQAGAAVAEALGSVAHEHGA